MNFLQTWDIYPDTIEEKVSLCEDALLKAGYSPTEVDEMYDNVRHITPIDNEYITASIIEGYFKETAKMLREKGHSVDYSVGDDGCFSYFIINGVCFEKGYKFPVYNLVEQLEEYEKFKEKWVEEHISDEIMEETKAIYDSDEELQKWTSFDDYVEINGFTNGKSFPSFIHYLNDKFYVPRDDTTAHNKSSTMER